MSAPQRFFQCNAPGVIFERFQDETVVINLDSGRYYTLDVIGAEIWRRLNETVALDQVITEIQRDYEGDPAVVDTSLRDFVALLLSEQLVRPLTPLGDDVPVSTAPAAPPPTTRAEFRPPTLAKYDDMAEMLLLDPVHDVAETGWPAAAPAPADGAVRVEDDDVSAWPALKRGG